MNVRTAFVVQDSIRGGGMPFMGDVNGAAKAGGTVLASVASEVTSALTQIEQTQTAPDPAPNAYTNYGGITAGTDGSVHFIFQTEGIGV